MAEDEESKMGIKNQSDVEEEFPFDYVSGYNLMAFTYLLHKYLPREEVSLDSATRLETENVKISKDLWAGDKLLSGSSVEGFDIPLYFDHEKGVGKKIVDADMDVMLIEGTGVFHLIQGRAEEAIQPWEILVNDDPNFPGYVHLLLGKDTNQPSQRITSLGSRRYLNAVMAKEVLNHLHSTNIKDYVSESEASGPAIKVTHKSDIGWHKLHDKDFDYVLAYQFNSWPDIGQNFIFRRRLFAWPSSNMIRDMAQLGCHIVAVGHSNSPNPELQFRWSFSLAEKSLARSINKTQRQAYILLKILHKEAFKEPQVISSYHLKNILFWTCEEYPTSMWTPSNLGQCLMLLLDKLIGLLIRKKIPSFFIPENNLIAHRSRDHLGEICKKVVSVRRNPLKYLLDFNQKHVFRWLRLQPGIESIFKPVINIMKMRKIPRNVYLRSEKYVSELIVLDYFKQLSVLGTTYYLAQGGMPDEDYSVLQEERFVIAIRHLTDCWKRDTAEVPLLAFVLRRIETYDFPPLVAIEFLHFLEKGREKCPTIVFLYWNLGLMYHRMVEECKINKKVSGVHNLMTNAGIAFTRATACPNVPPYIQVDFANFLCQTEQYENAVQLLKDVINLVAGKFHQITNYNKKDVNIVNDHVAYVIKKQGGKFAVPTLIYSYFLLAKSYMVLQHKGITQDKILVSMTLYHFRLASESFYESPVASDELKANGLYLLACTHYQLKRYKPSKKRLLRILELDPMHAGAVWMLKWVEPHVEE